jgi:hypothetical protein
VWLILKEAGTDPAPTDKLPRRRRVFPARENLAVTNGMVLNL